MAEKPGPNPGSESEFHPLKYHPLVEATRITNSDDENFGKTRIDSPIAADSAMRAAKTEEARKGDEYYYGDAWERGKYVRSSHADVLKDEALTSKYQELAKKDEEEKSRKGKLAKIREFFAGSSDSEKKAANLRTSELAGDNAARSDAQLDRDVEEKKWE